MDELIFGLTMTTYIALTALESHWGEPENTRLLTDGCRLYDGGNAWEKYGEPIDIERFHDAKFFEDSYNYCNSLTEKAMPLIAQALERELKLGMDERFYERIVYPWLLQFTQALYDRFTSIEHALERVPDACFLTAQMENAPFPEKDVLDAIGLILRDDSYNLLLYSDIISFFKLPQKDLPLPTLPAPSYVFGTQPQNVLKRRIRDSIFACMYACSRLYALCKKPVHYLHQCYGVGNSIIKLLLFWKGRCVPLDPYIALPPVSLNTTLRTQHLEIGETRFEKLLGTFLLRYLPFGACEALPELIAWAQKHPACSGKGVIATSVGIYTNIPLMVLAGVSKRPLLSLEHGGFRMHSCDFQKNIQERVADRYFSQGSASPYFLTSPYLLEKAQSKNCTAPLLVTNEGYRFLPRLMPIYCEGSMRPYHASRWKFLEAVPVSLRPHIRLYFKEFGWGVKKDLQERFESLHFQDADAVDMSQAMADTCLLVLDHYASTFHRAMATNTAIIVFSQQKHFTDMAKEVIEQMRRARIWHDTPESVAAFYTTLIPEGTTDWAQAKGRIDSWWYSAETQKARDAFCEKYAQTSPGWAKEWLQAFDECVQDGIIRKALRE